VVAYQQPVAATPGVPAVVVEIAQTLNDHAALTRRLWLRTIAQQLLLLALAALLVRFGLQRGLRPLLHLRDTVKARAPASLEPLPSQAMPTELTPLVEAINEYARQLDQYAGAQQVFVQNAAHQLRTPLTLLTTQVSYALRAEDGKARDESLAAIRSTVQHSSRLVNQLLTLSAVESQAAPAPVEDRVDLGGVVRDVLEDLVGHAQAKGIDLGFEGAGDGEQALTVAGERMALREITMNLVDNAIRYTQRGGIVTARIETLPDAVTLLIEDNGPGIPPAEREHVFERFYRLHDADSQGSGLGLAIVRELASRVSASVELRTSAAGRGLTVAVRFQPSVEVLAA
ncbi:MAG: ATP-binding protein, partial [Rhizobacter sp.]|nr:ATP-binding protein [Rhizobacter sp.]